MLENTGSLWPFSTLGWPDKTAELKSSSSDKRSGYRLATSCSLRQNDDGTFVGDTPPSPSTGRRPAGAVHRTCFAWLIRTSLAAR